MPKKDEYFKDGFECIRGCGNKTSYKNRRCQSCAAKERNEKFWKSKEGLQLKKELSIKYSGENNPNFRDGESYNNKCIDCDKIICYGNSRCRSCYNKFYIGENSTNYKSVAINCIICKKIIYKTPKQIEIYPNVTCSKECFIVWCQSKTLEKNPNWKNGKSFEPYPLGWNKTFKEQIRFRDGYTCQLCGVPEIECRTKLHVHHINYDKYNLNIWNLISLCISCHAKTNGNREYWQEFFQKIMEERKYVLPRKP